jgi:hypothetical protein
MNIIIPLHLLMKIQNDHHFLKFDLSGSCKSLNNSQLYRSYHISIVNSDLCCIASLFNAKYTEFHNPCFSIGIHRIRWQQTGKVFSFSSFSSFLLPLSKSEIMPDQPDRPDQPDQILRY